MPGGKKSVVALLVLMTGGSAAYFFRKDASQGFRQEATPDNPFGHRIERRAVADTAWIRNLSRPRPKVPAQTPAERVAPATASIPQGPAPPGQPLIHTRFSPVGSLLEPLDGVPPDENDEDTAGQMLPSGAPGSLVAQVTITHRIVDGDTLSKLAAECLGRQDRYLEIYELNRDVLTSPDLLPIGTPLKMPPRQLPARPPGGNGSESPNRPNVDAVLQMVPVPSGEFRRQP